MAGYPQARLRIYFDAETMLGPGKADLLQGTQETGSIAAVSPVGEGTVSWLNEHSSVLKGVACLLGRFA